jgi:short-subunit dehydrogenase
MLPRGEGVVVNTASILGLVAVPNASAYTATKFAVVGLSEALDLEYRDRGIRVLALCPGLVATNIIEDGRVGIDRDPEGHKTARNFASRGVSPDLIAKDVIKGVKALTPVILTPAHAKVIATARRYAPWMQRWLVERLAKRP